MSVVVDANLVAALLFPLPHSANADKKRSAWITAGERLFAPTLMEYEVCSALRRALIGGLIEAHEVPPLIVQMRRLEIEIVTPTVALHTSALRWAQRLGRARTYDAHYLAVAEWLDSEFWTADTRLYNRARQLGLAWVHCIAAPAEPPA